MSRGRFTTLLVLLAVAIAAGSFALALTLLSDDGPDELETSSDEADGGSDAPAATADATTVAPGPLETPALVVIVSSEREERQAQAVAERVGASGRGAAVLRSDDHTSLTPGFWVAYVGPFGDSAEAEAEVAALAEDGFGGAYTRCVGSEEECD